MEHAEFVDQVLVQAGALREAAVKAGPDSIVPPCPDWSVLDLVRHIARVHAWAGEILVAQDITVRPDFPRPPKQWDELLPWWDEALGTLVGRFVDLDPEAPTWMFPGATDRNVKAWARRQAHETAIHRLDAEHSAAEAGRRADPAHTLMFDPEFAADGIAEWLGLVVLNDFSTVQAQGTILFHAADAGRAWTMTLRPGEAPEVSPVQDAAIHTDAVVAGTADAIYRSVWNRPSTAVITGDRQIVDALPCP